MREKYFMRLKDYDFFKKFKRNRDGCLELMKQITKYWHGPTTQKMMQDLKD